MIGSCFVTPLSQWQAVWDAVREFSSLYPRDTIVIGGVAVYLHTVASGRTDIPAEFTHDADLYVGLPAWAEVRDIFEPVANRRLAKHQITVNGVELDLYVAHNNALRVSYADLHFASVELAGMNVAGLEHLLLLKLDAFKDRYASAHGQKDRRDIAKLLVLLSRTEPYYTLVQGTDEDVDLVDDVMRSTSFLDITGGNAHVAAQLRREAAVFARALRTAIE